MPLEEGSSQAVISKNIATERNAGKSEAQSVAIAENKARGDAVEDVQLEGQNGIFYKAMLAFDAFEKRMDAFAEQPAEDVK